MLRHARHVVQRTFTAWRDRVVEKQRRTLQRADADLFYKLCVAVRTFGRWRQHADQQIRLRAAHARFKHQRVLGALRWWRLYARGQRFTVRNVYSVSWKEGGSWMVSWQCGLGSDGLVRWVHHRACKSWCWAENIPNALPGRRSSRGEIAPASATPWRLCDVVFSVATRGRLGFISSLASCGAPAFALATN